MNDDLVALAEQAQGVSDAAPTLTFAQFRAANVARCIKWHPEGIASWSPSDWMTAVVGELGELGSLLKMRNRERDGLPGNKFSPSDKQVADELADVLTYLDLLAEVLGVDLGAAAVSKFNEVSERVGFPDRIALSHSPAPAPTGHTFALGPHGLQCQKCGHIWHEMNGIPANGLCKADAAPASPPVPQVPEPMTDADDAAPPRYWVQQERSYDQRVKMLIAFNTCTGDLDDKLDAAWLAALGRQA